MVGYAGIRPISLLDDPPEKRLPFDGEFHQGGYKKKERRVQFLNVSKSACNCRSFLFFAVGRLEWSSPIDQTPLSAS